MSASQGSPTYSSMLKGAKRAKNEETDTFEYFVKSAVTSEAFKMNGTKVIECRENVAGITLIFICIALIKIEKSGEKIDRKGDMALLLKSHLTGLLKMRTSTNVPLSVISESEGIMFPGEGMFLRFLNSLIILESLLLSKLKKSSETMKETWKLYSSLDLKVYLELPALLDNILSAQELEDYAGAIEPKSSGESVYEGERRMSSKLVRSMIVTDDSDADGDKRPMILFASIILFILYTITVIKLSKS